ncbi:hypothetical protein NKG05_26740 [Oerskovia sp. M15]
MARRPSASKAPLDPSEVHEKIIDIDVTTEMEGPSSSTRTRSSTPVPCLTPATASSPCNDASCSRCPTWACARTGAT